MQCTFIFKILSTLLMIKFENIKSNTVFRQYRIYTTYLIRINIFSNSRNVGIKFKILKVRLGLIFNLHICMKLCVYASKPLSMFDI